MAKIIKTLAAELWAGTTISTGPNFSVPQIPFSATATTMTMRVWAPAAGIPIRLKVEDASDPTKSCETETTTTVANAWQTLTFNFANQAPGTAALNLAYTYNKVSVFPNFGLTGAQIGAETTYYFDDLTFGSGNVPPVGGNSVIVDDFEDGLLPSGTDPNGIGVDFITWNHPAASAAISIIDNPPAQVPGADAGNKVLREALTIGGGQWAGYTHAFTNAAANQWLSQDWSTYEGVSLWLYGNNTGGSLFLDVMDNRNPGSTTDDAERWSVDIPDNFTGWRFFQFAWGDFHRKDIGNGAPNDGFGRTEIHGYGIGGYGSVPMGSQVYYVDDVGVIVRTTAIDDFEDGLLPSGTDPNGIGVGFITWNHPAASAAISIIDNPPAQVPGADAGNKVLREALTIGGGQWAGYTHAFTNAAANQWLSQDWSTYEGVSLWLYGNNTGGSLFLDVMDNRNPGSTTDDAERWSVDIPDNFTGWRSFQFAWGDFHRKDIGNGAPNDGFGRTEIHGYGIGGYGSVPMGSQVYYVDDVTIYGNTGGGPAPLQAQFALTHYTVTEGGLATISLTLSTAPTQTVTVGYRTAEAYARPNRNYIPTSGSVIFAPDETEKTFTVQTLADGKPSGDQQVMLNLSSVTNAAFGYRRRALLTITDTNAANPAMVDDFEGHHPFQAEGRVRLTIRDIPAGSTLAVPGQGPYEQVLKISVPAPAEASSTASITRTFAAGQNWSGYGNLAFWFYGANSGVPVKVKLLDNQAPTLPPPSQWVMAWSDEFNDVAGSPPDANAWGYELGDGTMNGIPGWGNSEEEFYSDSPDSVAMDGNGNLRLRLQSLDPATTDKVCWYGPCKYTSARLLTKNRTEFRYGRIEARVLVPSGESGLWPAFWSLGTNIDQVGWPQAGEIDIMEYVSRIPTEIFGTIHGPGYSGGNAYGNTYNFGSPVAAAYHTYAVEWAPNEIHWYVDGINYHNATPANVAPNEWVYNHPFYLLFNLAIGGNFGGSISPNLTFPQDMLVDYVRVYQAADTAERFEATFVDNIPGWRQIVIPFSAFTRSAVQPAGAPNDGLTLTNMTGYGFDLQVGQNAAPDSRTFHLDQVHLTITAPTAVTIAETSRTQPAPWLPLAAAMTVLALLVAALVVRRRLA
ncbi:carbohydrate binding domain-containing protein [Candidatus Amarolinea aalborgensis]|uniref:carbohydrate binding domain-containing protein n=1 Tax=Candidatus Amarolinea aalborgensis TaxID=2249329 RepID=UPI003BFA0410